MDADYHRDLFVSKFRSLENAGFGLSGAVGTVVVGIIVVSVFVSMSLVVVNSVCGRKSKDVIRTQAALDKIKPRPQKVLVKKTDRMQLHFGAGGRNKKSKNSANTSAKRKVKGSRSSRRFTEASDVKSDISNRRKSGLKYHSTGKRKRNAGARKSRRADKIHQLAKDSLSSETALCRSSIESLR